MKTPIFAAVFALISVPVLAQTIVSASVPLVQQPVTAAVDTSLPTPTGHELNVAAGGYTYVEPGGLRISIHGAKFSGEYAGTLSLGSRQHWFAKAGVRATIGSVKYDGWCSPWLITPDSASPNGYALDLGDAYACSDTGNRDWYLESRGLVGRDFVGRAWAWSPEAGIGIRHLSNGLSGIGGFRTDNYLYLPIGLTARTRVASHGVLSFDVEYDRLLRGWQTTRDSALGGGVVPATATAPAFTIDGFTDISFEQHRGWAVRASAKYQAGRRWSVEPYFVYWRVAASPVNFETVTFTVNGVTAREQLGAYEPVNFTREAGVKLGFRFR